MAYVINLAILTAWQMWRKYSAAYEKLKRNANDIPRLYLLCHGTTCNACLCGCRNIIIQKLLTEAAMACHYLRLKVISVEKENLLPESYRREI